MYPARLLSLCHVCYKHFKLRQDGTLVRHGGKVNGSECPGSSKHPPSSRKRRLLFIPRLILRKEHRGGGRNNISAKINSRLDAFGGGSLEELMKSVEPIVKEQDERVRKPKLSALVKCKIEQGNVRNAMRILASTDTMAPDSADTINSLKDKHPPALLDRKPSPNKESISVTVNPQQIMLCLRQFPKGTTGGRDGLTPQQISDLTHDKIETAEISAMTGFINLLLGGVFPPEVVPYLFGGRLVALIEMNDLEFLGSIVFRGKRHDNFWAKKLEDFKHIMSMMTEIGKHDALVLLTQAAFISRLSYFLRTSPGLSQQTSDEFNNELRMGFQTIFNVFFDDKGWRQAILPVNMSGLSLGVVAELAPSAFLSSAAATAALQEKILPMDVAYQDDLRLETFRSWCTVYGDIMDINQSDSNFRPDGYTLVPWSQGCCLSWDVTFPHTLAERYINYTAIEQGSAAVKAAELKNTKYKDLNDNTSFRSDLRGDIWPS
ncbi:hypothetical protein HELRODRAFT_164124 [Helobdella robusta]|uniref:Uncharacterized protein n=1 Tax=Helobdella robusta TaxID=6412 RepID=T1EUY8_HELRO|nr:hypothetical protein HELRODRAFT_164124 [Helobdella robusta]ESN94307.1 hypothetical protein HELRODRAFT_164124 [Helobdella robusta]